MTSLCAGWFGFCFLTFARDFCLVQNVQTSSGTHQGSYSVCTRVSSLGIKQPGSEADLLFPSCAMAKNKWSHTFTSPVCFHDIYRDTFALTFMEPEIHEISFDIYFTSCISDESSSQLFVTVECLGCTAVVEEDCVLKLCNV